MRGKQIMGQLSPMTEDLAIHQKLSDEPNDADGLSAAEMKAKFDAAGLKLQAYLNEKHLPEVEQALEETLEAAKRYADGKVVEIGSGDMAGAVYDPEGKKTDLFRYARETAKETLGDAAKFGYVCVGKSDSRQFKSGVSNAEVSEKLDLRELWEEEGQGFRMPEGARGFLVTAQVFWARQTFARCRVALEKDGEEVMDAEGPAVSDGEYVNETLGLFTPVKGGELVRVKMEVISSSSGKETGDIYMKYMKGEVLL